MNTLFKEYGGCILSVVSIVLAFGIFLEAFPFAVEIVKNCMESYLG